MECVKSLDIRKNPIQPGLIGVIHGPSSKGGEPIAVEKNHVDIAGPLGDTLFQEKSAGVDKLPETAAQNLVVTDLPTLDSFFP